MNLPYPYDWAYWWKDHYKLDIPKRAFDQLLGIMGRTTYECPRCMHQNTSVCGCILCEMKQYD